MRIALAQIDTTAGDVPGNAARIHAAWDRGREAGADLVVVPEMAVVGYPPRDLLLRSGLVRAAEAAVGTLAEAVRGGPGLVVGSVAPTPGEVGRPLQNVSYLLDDGRIAARYAKRLLPTYDVFDEHRYFEPGDGPVVVPFRGHNLGLLICEDLWSLDTIRGRRLYAADPPAETRAAGADLLIAISASPFHTGKDAHRRHLFAEEARRTGLPLVVVQQVGGNDDVLFDGRSRVFAPSGRDLLRLAAFREDFAVLDLDTAAPLPVAEAPEPAREIRAALVMGIRDYFRKTGFERAVVGLSGGVDSAVVACLAAEALGPDAVRALTMSGPYTSPMSREDAAQIVRALGIATNEVPIEAPYDAVRAVLAPHFGDLPFDVTEENIQARLRGLLLMAFSNKLGSMVLATGNKSEMAVGYATLYGDMNGGLAVLSDVWKTSVYDVAETYRAEGAIPARVIERPPSAELRPNQTDQDSLPPYPVLDRILKRRVEHGESLREIVDAGEDPAVVERVLRLLERSEYKRRQMAPGLKVTPTAFGVGWRMPIARPLDLGNEA